MNSTTSKNRVELNLISKGCCLICLECIGENNSDSSVVSISTLLRYLNVNVQETVSQCVTNFSVCSKTEWCDMRAELCSGCSEINSKVEELERVVEAARMKISFQLNSIHEKMRDAGRTPKKIAQYRRRMMSDPSFQNAITVATTESLRNRIFRESKEIASKYQPQVQISMTNLDEAEQVGVEVTGDSQLLEDQEELDADQNDFTLEVDEDETADGDATLMNSIPDLNFKTEMEWPPALESDTEFDPLPLEANLKEDSNENEDSTIPKSESPFECKICGQTFKNRSSLPAHLKNVHQKLRKVKCDICDKTFFSQTHATRHQNAVHLKLRYQCEAPGCSKIFSRSYRLRAHESLVHSIVRPREKKKIKKRTPTSPAAITQCEICGKTFKKGTDLRSHHDNVHLGIRRFQCDLCDRSFFLKKDANRHRDTVHFGNRYPCEFPGCGQTFRTVSKVKQHREIAHPEPE